MLDTYTYSSPSTNYVPFEKTVTEKKAPTDDSIRLYGEFLEKARNSIVDSFSVTSTTLNFNITIFRDHLTLKNYAVYKLNLNNQEFINKVELFSSFDISDRRQVVKTIFKAIAEDIALQFADKIAYEIKGSGL